MALNTQMIKDRAKSVWGRDISDMEAQGIMNDTAGGDEGQVMNRLQNDPTFKTQQFQTGQRAREDEFLGRFKNDFSSAVTGIEGELGLPQLRQNAQAAGQMARGVVDQVQAVAPTQQTIAKQVGISAPRLQSRIGAETARLQPALQTATRGAEEANAAQQFGETEFGRRLDQFLTPYKTEASMLSESLAREFTGFTNDKQNELTVYLQKLAQGHQLTMQELQHANQLADSEAEFERQKQLITLNTNENIRQSQTLKAGGGSSGVDLSKYLTPISPAKTPSTSAIDFNSLWDSTLSGGGTTPGLTFHTASPYKITNQGYQG